MVAMAAMVVALAMAAREAVASQMAMTDPGRPSPQPSATPKKIKVIEYNGKYLPVEQLIVEDEIGCGTDHWHAARGVVIATDGTPIQDPGPQCGYGKTRDRPVIDIEM